MRWSPVRCARPNTINIANVGQILTATVLPTITRNVSIVVAQGATVTLGRNVNANQNPAPAQFSELTIAAGFSVSITGLTIQGGFAQNGGAINSSGSLTLTNDTFRANAASGYGGAIYIQSTAGGPNANLTMTGSSARSLAPASTSAAENAVGAIGSESFAIAGAAGSLYNNGADPGTINAWTVNFGYAVTNSFYVAS